LLGTALAPLALGAVLRALGREPLAPRWLAALTLAALIGTYTEIAPLIGPALVVAVLARRRPDQIAAVKAAVAVLAVAVVAAPLVWVRAVRSLLLLGGLPSDSFPTAFAGAPSWVVLGRFLGVAGPSASGVSIALLVLATTFVLAGVVSALVLSARRWFYLTVILTGLVLSVYLVTVRQRPYTQQRLVQLLLPLVLIVAAVGWDRLWRLQAERERVGPGRRRDRPPVRARITVAVGLAGALTLTLANCAVDHDMNLPAQARKRHVGPEFAEAANWLRKIGGPGGRNASVLVGDFFSQLWITDALRGEPDVSYPTLYVSYQGQNSYWNGRPRRWLLTDRNAVRSVDPGVVRHRNSRFALLDLSRGEAVVAVPADEAGQNSVLVLRSSRGPQDVELRGATRPRLSTDIAAMPGYGHLLAPGELHAGVTSLQVDLGDEVARRMVLSDRQFYFMLQGVAGG
jgi:hypothetical protein